MNPALHDPRAYLFIDDDTDTIQIGEINADGLAGGRFNDSDVVKRLDGEQLTEYVQARSEAFHPVLLLDLETGVTVLEMRRHVSGPARHRDGV